MVMILSPVKFVTLTCAPKFNLHVQFCLVFHRMSQDDIMMIFSSPFLFLDS